VAATNHSPTQHAQFKGGCSGEGGQGDIQSPQVRAASQVVYLAADTQAGRMKPWMAMIVMNKIAMAFNARSLEIILRCIIKIFTLYTESNFLNTETVSW